MPEFRVIENPGELGRVSNEWEQLDVAPDFWLDNIRYQQAPRSSIPNLSHISPEEQERILWLNTEGGVGRGAYSADAPIPYALGADGRLSAGGRISPEWLDPTYDADKYTKFGVTPTTTTAPRVNFDLNTYTDALTRLEGYGREGLDAFAQNLNTAYPDSGFNVRSNRYTGDQLHSSQSGWLPTDAKTVTDLYNRPYQQTSDNIQTDAFGNILGHEITAYKQSPYAKQLVDYSPILQQTLTQFEEPSTELEPGWEEAQVAKMKAMDAKIAADLLRFQQASQPSPAAGAVTTTGGSIGGVDILNPEGVADQPSPEDPPINVVTGDDAPSPEETALKGLINDLAGTEIFSTTEDEAASDPPLRNYPWAPYVYEKPAQGLVTSMPLVSTTDNMANKYLQGGADAFSISGPQGYADVRQQLLGGSDVFTGPEVPWQRLGEPAPSKYYFGANFPAIQEDVLGDIKIPKPDDPINWQDPFRKRQIIADIPEGAFHPGNDTWGDRINKHYGDLETANKEQLMGDVESFWGDDWGTGLYGDSPKGSVEDFRFYDHPGVNKNINEGFGKIKNIFSKTGELVTEGKNLLVGVIDELTRFTERKGGRGSVTEGEPWGLSAKGLLDILKLDFKDLEKQGYGNLQPAALILASQFPPIIGLQVTNSLRDYIKDSINVSTFDSPKYDPNDPTSTAPAYNNAVEFTANVLRPAIKTVADFVLNDTTDASLKDKVKNAFGKDRATFNTHYDKDFSDQSTFELGDVSMEDWQSRHERLPEHIPTSGYEPTGEGTLTTALKPDYTGQDVSAGTTPSVGSSLFPVTPIGSKTLETIDVTMPEDQEAVSPHLGRGVSAGPSGVAGSSLIPTDRVYTGDAKSVDVELSEPETKLLPSAGRGGFSYVGSTRPRAVEGNIKDVETVDLISMLEGTGDGSAEGGSMWYGPKGQTFISEAEVQDYLKSLQQVEPSDTSSPVGDSPVGEPITLESPDIAAPKLPASKLDKDELQARTEELNKKLEEQVRENLFDTFGKTSGGANEMFNGALGTDLTKFGGYYEKENITNASPIDAAMFVLGMSGGGTTNPDGTIASQKDRIKAFGEKMELSLSKLAFQGADLNNVTDINIGSLAYPSEVWNNLSLQPQYAGREASIDLLQIKPDTAITNIQELVQSSTDSFTPESIDAWKNMPVELRNQLIADGVTPPPDVFPEAEIDPASAEHDPDTDAFPQVIGTDIIKWSDPAGGIIIDVDEGINPFIKGWTPDD